MKQLIPSVIPRHIPGCSETKVDLLPCLPHEPSFIKTYYQQIFEYINNERLKQVEKRLIAIGYRFDNMVYLKEFLEEQATIISYDDNPQYREMYLFYGTDKQMLIAIWYETIQFEHTFNDNKFGYSLKVIAGERP